MSFFPSCFDFFKLPIQCQELHYTSISSCSQFQRFLKLLRWCLNRAGWRMLLTWLILLLYASVCLLQRGKAGGTANQSQVVIDLCCLFSAFVSHSTGIQLCQNIFLTSPKPRVSLHQEQYSFTFFTCSFIIQMCLNTYCWSHIPEFREMPLPAYGGLMSVAAKILRAGKRMWGLDGSSEVKWLFRRNRILWLKSGKRIILG